MAFKYFKTFESGDIADGGVFEKSWEADEDVKIKRVYIVEKDGAALTKSTFYWKIKEMVLTHPVVPASVLGPDILTNPELAIAFVKGRKLTFTFKNLQGATVRLFIVFECWEP